MPSRLRAKPLVEATARAVDRLANPHDVNLAPSKLPRKVQLASLAVFAVLLLITLFFFLTEHWRRGAFAFGVTMLGLALLRLTCDSKVLGVLTVRSKRFDATFTALLGVAMIFLSISIDALGS
ncbi:DUF3017 domain-containing protein [Staphylococcus chromogenes]|nr:DUF3017 domain-containing protein [Staphylococcus chromogenes]